MTFSIIAAHETPPNTLCDQTHVLLQLCVASIRALYEQKFEVWLDLFQATLVSVRYTVKQYFQEDAVTSSTSAFRSETSCDLSALVSRQYTYISPFGFRWKHYKSLDFSFVDCVKWTYFKSNTIHLLTTKNFAKTTDLTNLIFVCN